MAGYKVRGSGAYGVRGPGHYAVRRAGFIPGVACGPCDEPNVPQRYLVTFSGILICPCVSRPYHNSEAWTLTQGSLDRAVELIQQNPPGAIQCVYKSDWFNDVHLHVDYHQEAYPGNCTGEIVGGQDLMWSRVVYYINLGPYSSPMHWCIRAQPNEEMAYYHVFRMYDNAPQITDCLSAYSSDSDLECPQGDLYGGVPGYSGSMTIEAV